MMKAIRMIGWAGVGTGLLAAALIVGCKAKDAVGDSSAAADDSAAAPAAQTATAGDTVTFAGACDASAAIALDGGTFVVANDEDNLLRVYSWKGGDTVAALDTKDALFRKGDSEADLEGGARIGDTVYWIGSHSWSAKAKEEGKPQPPNRRQLFATELRAGAGGVRLAMSGAPYVDLLARLTGEKRLESYKLTAAEGITAEEPGGLNIEGLAATPDRKLLVGFRNPVEGGRALVVPIENPSGLRRGEAARLGEPVSLDLDGLGIRDIQYWPAGRSYLVIAGSFGDTGPFALYRWAGDTAKPQRLADLDTADYRKWEAIVVPRDTSDRRVLLLSDDGDRKFAPHADIECKKLKKKFPGEMKFRGQWWSLPRV